MAKANFEDEVQPEKLLSQLQKAVVDPTTTNIQELEELLRTIDAFIQESEDNGEYNDFYEDIHLYAAPILNGVEFRDDTVVDDATSNIQVLQLVSDYIATRDENVEVILATNPHISEALKWHLAESEFEWEEDGTREALARNQNDPKLLAYLARVGNTNVRHQVALNHNTPADVLDKLVEDIDQCNFQMEECLFGELTAFRGFARWCVAQNPNTDLSTIKRILNNELDPLGAEADEEIYRVAKLRLDL